MGFDKDSLLYEFIIESKEFLSSIEGDFIQLEKCETAVDPELINRLFRAFHTIKGGANCIGMNAIGILSHEVETMLSLMRSGVLNPETKHIDAMLESVDVLNIMLDDVQNSNTFDVAGIVGQLQGLIRECQEQPGNSGAGIPVLPASDRVQEERKASIQVKGFEVTQKHLSDCPEDHDFLYLMEFRIMDISDKDRILLQLVNTGKVIEESLSRTDEKGAGTEYFIYQVLYSTVLEESLLSVAISPAPAEVSELKQGFGVAVPGTENQVVPEQIVAETGRSLEEQDVPETSRGIEPAGPAIHTEMPSETIRINVDTLDHLMMLAGELVLIRNQQLLNVDRSDPVFRSIVQQLDVVTTKLQEAIMRTRMQPVGNIFGKIPRIIRELEKKLSKQIEVTILGSDVELDKGVLEALSEPIPHLIRNCCDHGIELPDARIKAGKSAIGKISIETFHKGGQINIIISDDGKGISLDAIRKKALEEGFKSEAELNQMNEKQLFSLIFQPGFSTAAEISDVSGRGVGMDVVKNAIEKVGGSVELRSIPGKGTTVHLRMPLTLAIIPCLIVRVDGNRYAIPQINLEELICLYDDDVRTKIECSGNFEIYRLREKLLPLVRLSEVLSARQPFTEEKVSEITEKYRIEQKRKYEATAGKEPSENREILRQSLNFAVVKVGSNRFGLIIDEIEGTEEIVIKPLHSVLKKLICFSGATVMGDGKVVLILNIDGISRFARIAFSSYVKKYEEDRKNELKGKLETLLLFESGKNEHFAIPLPFVKRIERISMADVEMIGEKEFVIINGVSTRILRLENVMNVSPCVEHREMSVILPKYIEPQIGLMIANVNNIEKTHILLSDSGYRESGVVGTAIIRDHTTLLLDLYTLIEKAEPSWFLNRRNTRLLEPEKINILIIEDDPFYGKLLVSYLKPERFSLTMASNGKEALEKLLSRSAHLILTNMYLPVMNGWEFVANLRQKPEYSDLPVIGLIDLDRTSAQDRVKAEKLGFKGFELKINREGLIRRINEVLSSTSKVERLERNEYQ